MAKNCKILCETTKKLIEVETSSGSKKIENSVPTSRFEENKQKRLAQPNFKIRAHKLCQ